MKRKSGLGSIIRIALMGVAALIVIAIAAVYLTPVDTYRGPIEEAGTAATGRAVHLRGPLGFTFYPEIGITVSDVTFANAPGAREADMASVGRMIVGVKLMPLLSRRVEVTRLTLEKPVIHVEVDKTGKGNWVFETAKTGGAPANANPQTPAEGGNAAANISLSNLRIQDGTFSYFDARTGKAEEFTGVDVAIDTTALDQPFAVKAAATYKGHHLDVVGKLGNLGAMMNQAETSAAVSVSSDIVKVSLDGTVGGQTSAAGKLHLDLPSLREFAKWLEVALPEVKGLGAMAMDAAVVAEPQSFSASGIKLALDGMNLTGDFRMMTGGAKPALSGKLAVDRIDLNSYMGTASEAAAANAPAPADAGWSDTPVNLDILKAIDADLNLTAGTLLVQKLEITKAQIAVALKNGVFNANLQNIGLYQGTGKGTLTVDASKPTPTFKNALTATGLQVEPFLVAFLGVDRITGTGDVNFDVTAQGASPKALIASLGGKGGVTFKNGAIKGVDLAGVARSVQSALTGAAVGEKASTDFAELGGTFTINKGVMTNTDFHLLNPFIRMTGNGTVDLANRTLDFRVEPKVVATTQGQGGQAGLAGIGIPFKISGPWTKPSYGPDLQNVGKTIANTLINSLTGQGGGQSGAAPKPAIGDTLKGLFGR